MKPVTIERILCPIDFSEFSRDAIDHAVALATWYRAALTVMHVIEIVPVVTSGLAPDVPGFAPLPDREAVVRNVREFASGAIGTADVPLDVVVTYGKPAAAIQVQAEQMRADLVVVGTHGRSGFQRFLLGSVTEKLLRTIAVPLLIVPPPVKKPTTVTYEAILCPVDFSDASMRALDYALSLAQESGARIIVLHVLEGVLDELDPQQIRNVSVLEYLRSSEQEASERLRAAVPDDARVWAHPVERIVRGRAAREILGAADRDTVGLIVMGVRGRSALDRLVFGSTTQRVIREARCPVLTLHAEIPVEHAGPAGAAEAAAGGE
jgi:nucleotide-binding universal stress UspA family protein